MTIESDPVQLTGPAWGVGLATITMRGEYLDVWFPGGQLGFGGPAQSGQELAAELGVAGPGTFQLGGDQAVRLLGDIANATRHDPLRRVRLCPVAVVIDSVANPPLDAADAYLRLHLLSHRLAQPRTLNMDGIFGQLSNVAWTSHGPCHIEDVDRISLNARMAGRHLTVKSVDKFPRLIDYVIPEGVRIGDGDRVRLGAHLAPGTTVMHEGFVNFNAGTLGASMVEGRISAGVTVGDGSDVGGGASIMGTLSGGGKEVISIGQRCLIGANAGVGISLGDECIVEAGCYITAGAKLTLPDGQIVAARQLSGVNGMLFRRHSVTGTLEALPRMGDWGGLNAALHAK
ncbi:MAG: 2,3,4,5-tetrahydropyridine-2,6-dicarboxylate N-succinyltransferase [Corynebacteriales bacterium]|nr:2,3,4,5-tetrahydropyridine-2,6-dicarboxylate N-succinyltransferase [Mycobacteriales bacterium]